MRVYPRPGLRVRNPAAPHTLLPAAGLDVSPHDPVWARLVRDGDVVLEPPPADEAAEGEKAPPPADGAAGSSAAAHEPGGQMPAADPASGETSKAAAHEDEA